MWRFASRRSWSSLSDREAHLSQLVRGSRPIRRQSPPPPSRRSVDHRRANTHGAGTPFQRRRRHGSSHDLESVDRLALIIQEKLDARLNASSIQDQKSSVFRRHNHLTEHERAADDLLRKAQAATATDQRKIVLLERLRGPGKELSLLLLRCLEEDGSVDELNKIVKSYSDRFKLSAFHYGVLIRGLCRHREPKLALVRYQEMIQAKVKPSYQTAVLLMRELGQHGMVEDVRRVYDAQMRWQRGEPPNLKLSTALLQAFVDARRVSEVAHLVDELTKTAASVLDQRFFEIALVAIRSSSAMKGDRLTAAVASVNACISRVGLNPSLFMQRSD